ncbi:MAG: glycosyltransferase family 2 protein [Flavobacteriales bacterium]|nr:glycosyltransferase family 2 protein [Flavobacteriales bacterium]
MKKVAVVILNWNGEKFLKQFLPGVISHSQDVADTIVIDNNSTDGSLELLRSEFPQVEVVKLDKNYGFAGGYNHGLKDIPHEYFVLLNSDVEVTSGWIQPVIAYMESQVGMVACQPKILDYHRKEWFEYAGAAGGYIDKDAYAFCAGRIFFQFEKDLNQFVVNQEVFWASGAAMFIRRDAWHEVQGLDEDFFAHMEEIDLCWRLKNRGYKIGACRQSIVYHYGGGTLDRQSPFKTYLNFRNNLYMIVKNYHGKSLTRKLFRRLTLDGIAGMRFLAEGKWSHLLAVLKAHFSFYASMGSLKKKRKAEKAATLKPNLKGIYTGSIIKHFFIMKKRYFRDLDQSLFR